MEKNKMSASNADISLLSSLYFMQFFDDNEHACLSYRVNVHLMMAWWYRNP